MNAENDFNEAFRTCMEEATARVEEILSAQGADPVADRSVCMDLLTYKNARSLSLQGRAEGRLRAWFRDLSVTARSLLEAGRNQGVTPPPALARFPSWQGFKKLVKGKERA